MELPANSFARLIGHSFLFNPLRLGQIPVVPHNAFMKVFLLLFVFSLSTVAAGRDCLKEAHDFRLAHKITTKWNSDLDYGEKTIAQICATEDGDIDSTIELHKIIHRKGMIELSVKQTFTMGDEGDVYFNDMAGEVSNEELCVELDKYIKENSDCTTPAEYLRSIKDFEYKDFEKMCLQKLPEQQKRMISCRKK